jgi:hypothetical protein
MMLTPFITDTLAQAHHRDLLATAQRDRFVVEAKQRHAATSRTRPETKLIAVRQTLTRPLLLARRAVAAVTEVGCSPDNPQPLS